jgi:hypothetical protein
MIKARQTYNRVLETVFTDEYPSPTIAGRN